MISLRVDNFKNISFSSPNENILFDDVLLTLAEQGKIGNTLRLWESPVYFAVLGRTGKAEEDLKVQVLQEDAVSVLRRASGGGTVLQGPGCLNFSFILSKADNHELSDLRRSYHIILEGVLALLKNLGVNAVFRPISDLALEKNEKKFSGNAQRRGRNFILHHGTILYDFDLGLISRYLTMPRDIPDYRKGRIHEDFVTNIAVSKRDLVAQFQKEYACSSQSIFEKITTDEKEMMQKFLQEKVLKSLR